MLERKVLFVCVFIGSLLMLRCAAKQRAKKIFGRPDYLPVCFRNDPQLNQCLLNATEQIRPFLISGVPELKVPAFEPFKIPQIELAQGTRALNFKAVLKNLVAHGLSKYKFHRFEFNVATYEFFCEAKIPSLVLEGDYTVTGRVLIAPIEGGGKFVGKIDSCDVFVYQKYKKAIIADKKVHLVPLITNSSIEVEKLSIQLEGLFSGNEDLNAATNKAINDNVDELFAELKPVVEETVSKIMENVLLKSFIETIPWDDLYPVNPKYA